MASDDSFSTAVASYPDAAEDPVSVVRKVADHFECLTITVTRWADGSARPHPRMQKQILKWISEQG